MEPLDKHTIFNNRFFNHIHLKQKHHLFFIIIYYFTKFIIDKRDKIKVAVKATYFILAQVNFNAFINLTFLDYFYILKYLFQTRYKFNIRFADCFNMCVRTSQTYMFYSIRYLNCDNSWSFFRLSDWKLNSCSSNASSLLYSPRQFLHWFSAKDIRSSSPQTCLRQTVIIIRLNLFNIL